MTTKKFLGILSQDKWFAAVVLGEALLVVLGLALPLRVALSGRPHMLYALGVLTALRIFFLWGVASKQPKFKIAYIMGATLFLLFTLGGWYELYFSFAGYSRYPMHWGRFLLPFAGAVRIAGVSWYLVRGNGTEAETASTSTIVAITIIGAIFLSLFTPLGLMFAVFDRLIYGIHLESL